MKKRILMGLLGVLLLGVIIAQIFPPSSIDGPIDPKMDISADPTMSTAVAAALKKGCYDCHSNEPRYPGYTSIGAVKYYITNHIKGGSKHLNFSTWSQYPQKDKDHLRHEICKEIEQGKMPLKSYSIMHSEAVLTEAEKEEICKWANQL